MPPVIKFRRFSFVFTVFTLLSLPVFGGQYFQDFNTFAPGTTNFSDGSALYSTAPGSVASVADASLKELALTDTSAANTRSAFLLPDLDPGQAIFAFSAKWNAVISGNFPTAGSGYSFTFGSIRSIDLIAPGEGQENGYFFVPGISVSVRTFTSTPGIYLRVNGTNVVASAPNTPQTFWGVNNNARHFFEVDWDYFSGLTLRVDGNVIFTNVATTGFTPSAGDSFVFAARTSTATETLRVDNIAVVTGGKLVPLTVTTPLFFSSESSPGQEATQAFDGSSSTTWRDSINLSASLGGTVNNTPVRCYVMNNGVYASPFGGAAASWQFQGGDGTNWSGFGNATVQFVNPHENRAFIPTSSPALPAWRLNSIQNGNNSVGIGLAELTFYGFEGIGVPIITNAQAIIRTLPSVTLSAAVNPQKSLTTVVFELGTNTSYGWSATNTLAATSESTVLMADIPIPMLERQMPLYYRVRAFNAAGADIVESQTISQGFRLEQGFTVTNLGFVGTDNARFLDFYNHGKLDLAMSGDHYVPQGGVSTFRNDVTEFRAGTVANLFGNARNTIFSFGLRGAMAVADINGDNGPDFICPIGYSYSVPSDRGTLPVVVKKGRSVWEGVGISGGTFQDNSGVDFLQLDVGRVALADFDNDGRTDVLMTGSQLPLTAASDNGPFSQLYRNIALNTMQRMGRGVSPVGYFLPPDAPDYTWASTLEAGDLDGDGYPEVYQYGTFENVPHVWDTEQISRIYRNDQQMGLVPWQDLPTVGGLGSHIVHRGSSAVFADFNGDGYLDLLTAGEGTHNTGSGTNITRILFNDGTGILTNSGISLPVYGAVSVACGDIFNHGRNDIVMCGFPVPFEFGRTMVFRNDGDHFTPVDFGLRPISSHVGHGLDLGDYDEDGRLDLAAVGGNVAVQYTEITENCVSIYRNTLDIPSNQPPAAPSALASSVGAGNVLLSWTNAVDDITPKNLLTYNVYITTAPAPDIPRTNDFILSYTNLIKVSPLADFITGKRKVPQPGNAGHAYRHPWRLPPGTYYWSVQAIDGGYAGGPWAPEQTFTITEPERPPLSAMKNPNGTLLSWSGRFSDFQLEYNDSLTTTNWISNSIPTVIINGKMNVTYTNAPSARFFRLRKP